ncbi:SDR family NAD(P)-dependent oxidoreductase [Desulfobacula phenolica]|uniref:Short-chain dehydrogenase n=1 Tax=Desulfobacula phenolica TaxID=90732 RepID=A0A1H2DRR9_9BACT|nr:SDR family NAD(P)-dependent oxidoreductase [Desulfobacula phenolica]SDT85559.1 hypothetical protein SAMN04487931_10248 [Desulfobacula phenolica]
MRNRLKWKEQVAFITGASSGLGRSLAIELSKRKTTLILLGRNPSSLDELKKKCTENGSASYSLRYDLTNLDSFSDVYGKIISKIKKNPTLLFNCAGYNPPGFIMDTPVNVFEENFRVNTFAPVLLIQQMLPKMLKNNFGVIVNIMSSGMYHSFPGMGSYCSSKMALAALHESLKTELDGTSVRTLYVNPGAFQSNYFQNMRPHGALQTYNFQSKVAASVKKPEIVVEKIISAIEDGGDEIDLSTWKDKIGCHLNYWMPRFIDKMIVKSNKALLEYRDKYFQRISHKKNSVGKKYQ